jgi:PST family polysaccharide transporter
MWRELVAFGRPVIGAEFLRRIAEETGTVLVGAVLGPASLGAYYYARRVALQPVAALVHGVSYVVYPAFAHIAAERDRLREGFLRSLRWMSAVALPLGMLLIPLGHPLVALVFGSRWARSGDALAALMGYAALQPLISLSGEALKAAGRPAMLLRIQGLAAVSTAALVGGLVTFGLVGVALAISAASLATCVYALALAARAVGVAPRRLGRELGAPALAALAALALAAEADRLLDAGAHSTAAGLSLLAAEAVAALVLYAVVLLVASPTIRREVRGAPFSRLPARAPATL